MDDKRQKTQIAHEAILLSRVISERQTIKITFPDGEYLIDQLRWHTFESLGLKNGKVVNKNAIKYWEVTDSL
jgi:major membrane immunogen (membrane-anchored lipoprotein)